MQTVVITGSARGFGYEMLKLFREKNYNVVLCDISKDSLKDAEDGLNKIKSKGEVLSFVVDVTKESDVNNLIKGTTKKFGSIDIWINNAGVNQPNKYIWELDSKDIDRVIDIDLKGSILCSKLVIPYMNKQGNGSIYFVEGHGSNDAKIKGLSIYGTAKRGVTYFADTLGYELENSKSNILVGKITPGIMITNFINTSLGDGEKIELDEKTKNIYNILGDYPETIAKYMVDKIVDNKKTNVKFTWLTTSRAMWRFISYSFNKRDFFK